MIRRLVARSLFWRRVQAGLLQRELAERANIDPSTVGRAERGAPQRLETLRRIADALGVMPAELELPAPTLPDLKQPPEPRTTWATWSRRAAPPANRPLA